MNQYHSWLSRRQTFRRRAGDFYEAAHTVKGTAEVIFRAGEAYQCLLDSADHADVYEGIRQGLDDVAHGRTRRQRMR